MTKKYIIQSLYCVFSISFFVYVIYKSEIVNAGLKHDFYFKYYLFSATLLIFSLISFYIKKDINLKIFTILLATVLSLYFIEFYLSITKETGKDHLGEFTKEFKKEKPSKVRVVYPYHFINENKQKIFSFGGISNLETIFCHEDYLVKYKSDRFGFNNPNEIWDNKKKDILLIGDSFTHGVCVFPENNIRSKIQKYSSDLNVLNLGIGGSGSLMQYAILKEYYNLVNPKKVLWIYYEENDIHDLIFEKKNHILNNYLKDNNFKQNIITKQKEIDKKLIISFQKKLQNKNNFKINTLKYIKDFLKLKKFRYFLRNTIFINKMPLNVPSDFKNILSKANEFLKVNNTKMYFVYLPEKRRFNNSFKIDEKKFNHYPQILKIVEELEIPIINIYEDVFKKHSNPLDLFAKNGSHFNAKGYDLTALKISNFIKDR